ncbi:hypothetical protein H9P43_007329 [Blastocladiella emersonii ATCC 22665]|nr:hypothetical protein H9P43_007329 [Blastocladiella emersonii ATCC 22665]
MPSPSAALVAALVALLAVATRVAVALPAVMAPTAHRLQQNPLDHPGVAGGRAAQSPTWLSIALFPEPYFSGTPVTASLDPADSSSSSPTAAPPSVCITLTSAMPRVHSAKAADGTYAKLYAQPGCSEAAAWVLDRGSGKVVPSAAAALALHAPGDYLKLRRGRGFPGAVGSVRLCSEAGRAECA